MTWKVRKNSTEIFLVGPVTKTDGVANFGSALLTSASAAVAFLHDTASPVDISSYTWTTASVGGTIIPGYYHLTLASAITSVPGRCAIVIQNSTDYLPVRVQYEVLGSSPYDAIYASAPTLLTAADVGLILETTISTVNTQLSYDVAASIATDNVWIGNVVAIEDTDDASNTDVGWVSDVDSANNRIIVEFEGARNPLFTVATSDKVRVHTYRHPQYAANTGVNVTSINSVTVQGAGTSGDLWRA